mmetsp:Transcript_50112/g.50977  ORF Transcript_50112/g.50977 Transcript_50112/m.50977 type:complete len:84 (+) Transcript_50112:3-254(+)
MIIKNMKLEQKRKQKNEEQKQQHHHHHPQQQQQKQQTIARSLLGWSNIRSSMTLTLVAVYIIVNNKNCSLYCIWKRNVHLPWD